SSVPTRRSSDLSVNPGVGMASQKKNVFYKEVLDDYENSHYLTKDGIPNNTPVGKRVARLLKEYGLSSNNSEGIQVVDGIYIYPAEYFCPLNYFTGELHITDKTVAIHHFRSEEHTSELQSRFDLVCRLLLHK